MHNPFLNETFYAVRGKGAFLNNHKIHIKDTNTLKECVICWVACGRLQCYYEENLFPWDAAAAKLIATEAKASVGNYSLKMCSIKL